jgi:hypothetical protein
LWNALTMSVLLGDRKWTKRAIKQEVKQLKARYHDKLKQPIVGSDGTFLLEIMALHYNWAKISQVPIRHVVLCRNKAYRDAYHFQVEREDDSIIAVSINEALQPNTPKVLAERNCKTELERLTDTFVQDTRETLTKDEPGSEWIIWFDPPLHHIMQTFMQTHAWAKMNADELTDFWTAYYYQHARLVAKKRKQNSDVDKLTPKNNVVNDDSNHVVNDDESCV